LEGRSWHHVERPCRWRAPLRPRTLPKLNTLWVICDHTSGSAPGYPTPAAQVADIDLAVGRLIAAISHSKDYKDSAASLPKTTPKTTWTTSTATATSR